LRAETAHEMNFGWALPRVRLELQHDFKGEQNSSVAYADLPNTQYALTPTTSNQNSILFGVGSDFILRNGLRLSADYQIQRSSMHENSQAVLFKLTKEFDGKAPPPLLLSSSGFSLKNWKIKGSFGYTFDDNINRSSDAVDKMSDSSYNLDLNKSWLVPLTDHTRLVIGSSLGGEKFHTYTGLDHMYLGGQVEYQYRASGDFGTPIWGIFTNATGDAFSSTLRDGYRYSVGLSLRKPLTDRINMFSSLARNERHGKSAVFDTKDNSFKFNLDYAVTDNNTLYLNTEHRRGDLISSGSHTLQNIDIAKVFALDDVYTRNDFYSYRFNGTTTLIVLGYNVPFGPKDSIDISWQRVRSAASKSPSVATWPSRHYFDNQLSVVYLFSF
ncbi:MAG: autotransporter domain-containing protein, partial [Burkholderiaceae bacterium]